ncbi:MAG: hypothetical protein AAF125_11525 [Chloroflexota bacterium]
MKLTPAQQRMMDRLAEHPLRYGANWDKRLTANTRVVDNLVDKGLVRVVKGRSKLFDGVVPWVVRTDDERYRDVADFDWDSWMNPKQRTGE